MKTQLELELESINATVEVYEYLLRRSMEQTEELRVRMMEFVVKRSEIMQKIAEELERGKQ